MLTTRSAALIKATPFERGRRANPPFSAVVGRVPCVANSVLIGQPDRTGIAGTAGAAFGTAGAARGPLGPLGAEAAHG